MVTPTGTPWRKNKNKILSDYLLLYLHMTQPKLLFTISHYKQNSGWKAHISMIFHNLGVKFLSSFNINQEYFVFAKMHISIKFTCNTIKTIVILCWCTCFYHTVKCDMRCIVEKQENKLIFSFVHLKAYRLSEFFCLC
jgi:hypothetical protein